MLVTCQNIGKAFIYWLRHHSTIEERTTICELLACEGPPGCIPLWADSAEPECRSGLMQQEQQDGCGNTRYIFTSDPPTACGGCVTNWTDTGSTRCVGDRIEHLWHDANDCYPDEWRDFGSVTWVPSGAPTCVGGTWRQTEVNNCGTTRLINTGAPCGGCVPSWIGTGNTRCNGANFEQEWTDVNGCFPNEWHVYGPVIWTDSVPTETECREWEGGLPDTCYTMRKQTNQCGEVRWIPHNTPPATCACCEPDWEFTGTLSCALGRVRELWHDNNACFADEYRDVGPVTWSDFVPPHEACVGGTPHKEQHNQCGETRWVSIPSVWLPTGNTRCIPCGPASCPCETYEGGCFQRELANLCGVAIWETTAPITWVDTGNTRCRNNLVEKEQSSGQCAGAGAITRWVHTTTPPTACEPLEVTLGADVAGGHTWTMPCDVPPETAAGMPGYATVAVAGGSGSYTYSWTTSVFTSGIVPFTVTTLPSSPTITLQAGTQTCPAAGDTEVNYTVTVTDTVTGQLGTYSGVVLIEFTG